MISIIIPAYNEEKRIGASLKKIKKFMGTLKEKYEIIVVDDGSTDKTNRVAKKYRVRVIENKLNRGKGFSVKNGVLNANGDLILFSDADLSTPVEELKVFLKFMKDYDIVIGSRGLKESRIKKRQPWYRHFIGKTFNRIVRLLTGIRVKDTQCGFKLFTREAAKRIFTKLTIERWGFDVEVLYLAKKYNFKVKEQPVTWLNSAGSKVNPMKDSIKMFFEFLKVMWNDVVGRY